MQIIAGKRVNFGCTFTLFPGISNGGASTLFMNRNIQAFQFAVRACPFISVDMEVIN